MSLEHELVTDTFHRHGDALRILARKLLGNIDDADDVVQDAWGVALERSPIDVRSSAGWMTTVVRSLVRDRRRRAARVPRVSASTDAEATDEVAERWEASRDIARAVDRLAEPYRRTVLLRFFDHVSIAEIASREGIAVSTVRSRTQRALVSLREDLERTWGSSSNERLAQIGGVGLGSVGVGGATSDSAESTSTGPAGDTTVEVATKATAVGSVGVASTKIAAIVLGALVLIVGVPLVVASWPDDERLDSAVETAQVEGKVVGPRRNRGRFGSELASSATPTSRAVDDNSVAESMLLKRRDELTNPFVPGDVAPVDLEVRFVDLELRPGETMKVHLERRQVGAAATRNSADIDGADFDGEVRLRVPPALDFARKLVLVVEHPRVFDPNLSIDLASLPKFTDGAATVHRLEVRLRPASVIRGRVRFDDGRPGADAWVLVQRLTDGRPDVSDQQQIGVAKNGTYSFRLDRPGRYRLTVSHFGWRPAGTIVVARPGDVVTPPDITLERGFSVAGTVSRQGVPLRDARVGLALPDDVATGRDLIAARDHHVAWIDGRVEIARQQVWTDDTGHYVIRGLSSRAVFLSPSQVKGNEVDVHIGFGERLERRVVPPAGQVDFDLAGGRLDIVLRAKEEGVHVDQALVQVFDADERPWTTIRSDGETSCALVPEAPHRLEVHHPDFAPWTVDFVAPAAGVSRRIVVELVPRPTGPTLIVRLDDARSGGAKEVALHVYRPEAPPSALDQLRSIHAFTKPNRGLRAPIDEHSVARFDDLPILEPGRYRVMLRIDGTFAIRPFHTERGSDFLEITTDVDLPRVGQVEVHAVARKGGRLKIESRTEGGIPVPAVVEIRDATDKVIPVGWLEGSPLTLKHRDRLGEHGSVESDRPLPPGRYRVVARHPLYRDAVAEVDVRAGEVTPVLISLRLP